jgi:hypothetical protein
MFVAAINLTQQLKNASALGPAPPVFTSFLFINLNQNALFYPFYKKHYV